MVRILFILLFSGTLSQAFSQLKIVKDNIACTYGLKNESGEWIVPATYVLLEEMQGYFRATTAEGRGVLTSSGKVLVKPMYDVIELLPTGFFKANIKNYYTVINKQGRAICKLAYTSIIPDPNGLLMLYNYENSIYKTTCIDTTGNVVIPEQKGYIAPFGAYSFALIGQYPGYENSVSGEAGVIDRNGKLMVPRDYEYLKYCSSRLIFRKNYKTGVIDLSNNVLLEAKYAIITPNGSEPCFRETDVLRIMDGNKTGYMRGNGEILIHPELDELVNLYPDQQTPKAHQLFRKGSKMGIISVDYKLTTAAVYDTLIPRPRISWNESYQQIQQNKKLYFQFGEKGKYGLLKDDGTVVCKAEYDNFLRSDYAKKPAYFVSKGLELYLLDYSQENIVPEKARLVARYDTLLIYESRGELLPCFIRGKKEVIAAMGSEHFEYRTYGNIFVVATRNGYHYFTTEGKPFLKNKVMYMDVNQGKYYVLCTKAGKRGIYHSGMQKLIIDTLYENFNLNNAYRNVIWGMLPYKAGQQNGTVVFDPMNTASVPLTEWVILDTNGRRINKTVFDGVVFGEDTTHAYSRGLTGIVDRKMDWLIPPDYRKILQVARNYFAVQTKGGKYGIVDLQHHLVVDTVYTNFEEIFIGSYSDWKRYFSTMDESDVLRQRWYLLRKNNQQALFGSNGKIIQTTDTKESEKLMSLLVGFAYMGSRNMGSNSFRIQTLPHQDSMLSAVRFTGQLYQLLKVNYDSLAGCNPLDMQPNPYFHVPKECYTRSQLQFSLKSLGKKHVCIESSQPLKRNSLWYAMQELHMESGLKYENYIWRNEKLDKLELNMLFPDIEQLEAELIRILQQRDDLKLSCSSPATILVKIGNDFCLRKEGLTLYYKDPEHYEQIEFLVTAERLAQNPAAKWILPYLD